MSSSANSFRFDCSDNIAVTMPKHAGNHSELLTSLFGDHIDRSEDVAVPLDFPYDVVVPVVDWLRNHEDVPPMAEPVLYSNKRLKLTLTDWEETFFGDLHDGPDDHKLFKVLEVASFLGIRLLIHQGSFFITRQLKGKHFHEVRQYLNLEDDLPEELKKEIEERKQRIAGLITPNNKF